MLIKQNRRGVNTWATVEHIVWYTPSATLLKVKLTGHATPEGAWEGIKIRNKAKVYNPEYNFKTFPHEHCSKL